MEIERKFTIKNLPKNLEQFPFHVIEQAYLNTDPVVRVRREDDTYYMTYKGKGMMAREEYNLPLNKESYFHLIAKADGNIICKKRYLIPHLSPKFKEQYATIGQSIPLTIELDIFEDPFSPLMIAEVEFPNEEMCNAFIMPDWFQEDVTLDKNYHNSNLSKKEFHK
ncbi:MAG TPA: CYTH domain-containing protein [Lachnospiraceae bacterium]|nr:CYTH domain-containing protein [Lachnospiraceae bacterium]